MGKNKKRGKDGRKAMSPKRLEAVRRIERSRRDAAPTTPAAPPAGAGGSTSSAATAGNHSKKTAGGSEATGRAAELIRRAHGLGLSVAPDAPETRVAEMLEEFDLLRQLVEAAWPGFSARRRLALDDDALAAGLNVVTARLFEDGRELPDLLSAARQQRDSAAFRPARRQAKLLHRRLAEEFLYLKASSEATPSGKTRRGLIVRVLGRLLGH